MRMTLYGLITGFIIVLPGMSGGTVFVILGIYEKMIKDLARFKIKPYLPLSAGLLVGIFLGGLAFGLFFQFHRDATASFLLGCLLASIKAVLKYCPQFNLKSIFPVVAGFLTGFFVVSEPIGVDTVIDKANPLIILLGGAVSSAAMIIPGVPGNSVLILLGIYDTMLVSLRELYIINLLWFGFGGLIGVFFLVKLVENLYTNYRSFISYFFAGIILGSSRALLPQAAFDAGTLFLFAAGFMLVWFWSGKTTALENNSQP